MAVGDDLFKVKRPAGAENKDMQLYFNCLGWADNITYVQIHKVVYEPPSSDEKPSAKSAGDDISKKRALDTIETEVEFPDYAKILKGDPELRKQVDELINSKQGK